jgi:hypothetical protein
MFTLTLTLPNAEPFEVGLNQSSAPLAIAEARRLKTALVASGCRTFTVKVSPTLNPSEVFFDYACHARPRSDAGLPATALVAA